MTAVEALTELIGQFDQELAGLEKQGLRIVIDEEDIDFCRFEGHSMSLGVSLDLAKSLLVRAKAEANAGGQESLDRERIQLEVEYSTTTRPLLDRCRHREREVLGEDA
jgi:hypothetical protein